MLGAEDNARIVKVDWFRGTESRGSNSWKEECDLLIVAGTPRVPVSAVQNRLLQLGLPDAANREGQWGSLDYWSGRRLDGRHEMVHSRGYRDHDWYEAARQIVHAEIIQAVGRSRSVCSDGIPDTIILSTEPLGYLLADNKLEVFNRRIVRQAVWTLYHLLSLTGLRREEVTGNKIPHSESCPYSRNNLLDGGSEELTAKFAEAFARKYSATIVADCPWRK